MSKMLDKLPEATRMSIDQVCQALVEEFHPLAILLTGPQAFGIEHPDEKLYFVVLVDDESGVIEHRFAETYAGIERAMEIGIFPRELVEKLAQEGYWDMVSLRAAEAIRLGICLYDPRGYGQQAVGKMSKIIPEERFITSRIHRMVSTFDDAVSLYQKGDYPGSVLVAREAVRLAIEIARKTVKASEEISSDEIVRDFLGDDAVELLHEALGLDQMSPHEVEAHVERARDFAREILKELNIADDLLKE